MNKKNTRSYWIATGLLAFAGFFFVMSGALVSHLALGDSANELIPSLVLLILIVLSWYFRPASRKINFVNS